MSKIIYLASPYTHEDKNVRELRFLQVADYTAKQMILGNIVFSPITYGHVLSEHQDMPTDFEFWENFCFTFLSKCSEMHVLKLDGWSLSKGVFAEEQYCRYNDIDIKYIDFEE